MDRTTWKELHRLARTLVRERTDDFAYNSYQKEVLPISEFGWIVKQKNRNYPEDLDLNDNYLSFEEEAALYHILPPDARVPTVWIGGGSIMLQPMVDEAGLSDRTDPNRRKLEDIGLGDLRHNMGYDETGTLRTFDWGVAQLGGPLHRKLKRRRRIEGTRTAH